MKIKTSELTGPTLDWAVAKCVGEVTDLAFDGITWGFKLDGQLKVLSKGWAQSMMFLPSTNWEQGGPIIEREKIGVWPSEAGDHDGEWCARKIDTYTTYSPTPLIAAMRCYVGSRLGDEVEVPEELK